MEYTRHLPSPEIFRKWAGISAVAGACERRVWSSFYGMELYPNLFVLLIGSPGSGKTLAISQVERLWRSTGILKIASKTMTKAGLVDTLVDARRVFIPGTPGEPPVEYHSLQIPSEEFGNLVPAYDLPFMNVLNELFDCGPRFSERLRGAKEELVIKNPQITIVAGTQPDYLTTLLPDEAWGQGFTSRNILIYSPPPPKKSLREALSFDRPLRRDLEHDLIDMTGLHGEFIWADEAWAALDEWHLAGGPPAPTHMRLEHYLTRRTTHVEKLSMIASVSRSNELVVRLQDFQTALSWLLEAEAAMPQIFRLISMGGDSAITYDAWQWAVERYEQTKKPIPERHIISFLHMKIEAQNVLRTIDVMEKAGMLSSVMDNAGRKIYIPLKLDSITSEQKQEGPSKWPTPPAKKPTPTRTPSSLLQGLSSMSLLETDMSIPGEE